MSPAIPVSEELLNDASVFTAIAVALALLAFLAPPERRRGLVVLAAGAVIMLTGLFALQSFGATLGSGAAYDIAREALFALLAVAVIRAIVLFVARVLLGGLRVPHILVDAVFVLGIIAYGIYRLNAVGVNLAGVVTTSAILTGALAFSANETLGNLWAGVSLQLENTLRIGDWVRIDDKVGQVVSIRWRSMAIATSDNETFVVPNSQLMKDRVVVLGRAGETHALLRRGVLFQVDYDHAPSAVIAVIDEALDRCEIPLVARSPAPFCVCVEFQDSGILYRAVYFLTNIAEMLRTDSMVLTAIYAALARRGMPIPFPQQVVEVKRRSREQAQAETSTRTAALAPIELFDVLTDEERTSVAAGLKRLPYAVNDVIFRKGEAADSLYILARGRVRIMDDDAKGHRTPLAELSAPAYFGEMGLMTGQPRRATIISDGDVLCYGLGKSTFDAIVKGRPAIVDALGQVLARRQAENDATLKAADDKARGRHAASGAGEIIRRIKQFFALPADRA
ncbi:MAG TPA: mechanosensitive ion channel family protein [Casimicrobiaceae bacterium]|nr:mechanosensitive ion channel family protein [Casimicrobiaceae bacterium]